MRTTPITLVVNPATTDLMVTALINIGDIHQQFHNARCLIDTCSTTNFITESFARKLQLPQQACTVPVGSINALSTISSGLLTATIFSRHNGYQRTLQFLIVPIIADTVPEQPILRHGIHIPSNIKLADPNFHVPAPVDILIGAGTALSVLCIGQINISPTNERDLFLQKTQFGWVIGGSAPSMQRPQKHRAHVSQLNFDISKFWEIEDSFPTSNSTQEEEACEQHFREHVQRGPDGRYIVALPFNKKIHLLGDSRTAAEKRFRSLQRSLTRNSQIESEYRAVVEEYVQLGHMTEVTTSNHEQSEFILPHHAVIKESSQTTKLRVVFDGSMKTNTGISLNDALLVGPTIQDDLFSLLLKFRFHHVVLTGDIEKMYRQFYVRPEDRKYQRILWSRPGREPKVYELNTITFGLASAPFLAIRCLTQLSQDEGHAFPLAAKALVQDFYVDDALTGARTIEDAVTLRNQLIELLSRAGLKIRQWASNVPQVLEGIPNENINTKLQFGESTLKTLGIYWNSTADAIVYTVDPISSDLPITKRSILSQIAKIFDPLGLLAPVIITAKILMQKLWSLKLNWDESLPANLHHEWFQFQSQLSLLNNFHVNRKVILNHEKTTELHGFCDASMRAYGACIYVKSSDEFGNTSVNLLCAKSKVAPLKPVTIPRLELCGALLLAKLMSNAIKALNINVTRIIYWTDSTIVLHWLKTPPQQLKTFVSHRVSEIQSLTKNYEWRHVGSTDNPADLVSRGQQPQEFMTPTLWAAGPCWLAQREPEWSSLSPLVENLEDVPEQKKNFCFHLVSSKNFPLFEDCSSIRKLQSIVAYCLRFKPHNQQKGLLSLSEYRRALLVILKRVQRIKFSEEINSLLKNKPLSTNSRLIMLNPFLDPDGLLRVGGRLKNAPLPYSQKHPIIIPKGHHVTSLLIQDAHYTHLHAGNQTTLYALRTKYWLIDGRSEVRRVLRLCQTCRQLNPPSIDYLMGDLPPSRLTPCRPFTKVGIDFCGPFFIKEKKHRNRNQVKVYVSIFVCLAIKAVHLEVVSELTTEAFLAALRRFTARRGLCTDIYSDNATNFVGAKNELRDLYELFNNKEHKEILHSFTTSRGIQWHFIPARSPNFGGLWEAAVKSFKHHLRRVVGTNLFTFEEFNTFTIEIEAVLNSRPLTPISTDPNDFLALTPGHFLTGDSLTSLPESDLQDVQSNRLSHWQHIQRVKQHFWSRWSREYINELTVRHKWTKKAPNITEGQVVLLKEDNLPPLQWMMGRVVNCHPGPDGIVRVVTVKTSKGTFKRSVKKVAPLFDS